MAEIRVSTSESTAWEDMGVTTQLDDLSAGDTITGEGASGGDSSPNLCRFLYAEAHLKVQERLGTIYTITGLSYTVTLSVELNWP